MKNKLFLCLTALPLVLTAGPVAQVSQQQANVYDSDLNIRKEWPLDPKYIVKTAYSEDLLNKGYYCLFMRCCTRVQEGGVTGNSKLEQRFERYENGELVYKGSIPLHVLTALGWNND